MVWGGIPLGWRTEDSNILSAPEKESPPFKKREVMERSKLGNMRGGGGGGSGERRVNPLPFWLYGHPPPPLQLVPNKPALPIRLGGTACCPAA